MVKYIKCGQFDNRTALEIAEMLDYGDEIDAETSDGLYFSSWLDTVSFGSAWQPKVCMFIQVDDYDTDKCIFYAGEIESYGEFKLAKQQMIEKLS
jgi:hypothetical protein